MTEILKYIIDGDGSKAISEFKKVGTAAETEMTGKTGNAASGLGKTLGVLAVGGAAAIAGLAAKGISDFANLGQEVLKFQRVAGDTSQDASKWIEAFSDYGVSADTAATLMGKFEKAIPAGKLAEFGIAVAKTKDGNTDVSATLLKVADAFKATEDPAERARLGAALFGKTWQDAIPLLEQGAEGLKKSLDGIEPGKILSEDDVKRAEEMRLAIDNLKDKFESLMITVGKIAFPALEGLGHAVESVNKAFHGDFSDNDEKINRIKKAFKEATTEADNLKKGLSTGDGLGAAGDAYAATLEAAGQKQAMLTSRMEEAKASAERLKDATKEQAKAVLDNKEASDADTEAAKARIKVLDDQEAADKAAKKAVEDSTKAFEDHNRELDAGVGAEGRYAQAQLDLIGKAKDEAAAVLAAKNAKGLDTTKNLEAIASHGLLLEAVDNAAKSYAGMTGATQGSVEWQSRMADSLRHLANSDIPGVSAAVAELITKLGLLPSDVPVNITVTTRNPGGGLSRHPVTARAGGGMMDMGATWVGEGGPELVSMSAAGPQVIPASSARSNGHPSARGDTITLNITPPPGARTAKQFAETTVAELQAYRRRNGKFPWE